MVWRAVLLVMLLLRPVWAQDIPGQADPGFHVALTAWLADDEAAALPELARLAQGGNRAAQVLLAMIDKGPGLQGPWLSALPRDARVALLRAPGGISGTSWMRLAAEVPVAGLWLRLWDIAAEPGIVLEFASLGEPYAARVAVLALRSRQERRLETIAAAPDFPPAMRFALWEAALPGLGLAALAARALAEAEALPQGDPQRAMAGIEDGVARESWFETSQVGAPVAALCLALCPETYDTCTAAALGGVGGYRGLVALGSPVEALIGSRDYAASARGRADLLRRALLRWPISGRAGFMARASSVDGCFGAALAAEAARY